jgi:Cd2+/Zn2+-exporting ATPase
MKKHRLELGLALPVEAHECDACIGRLVQALESKPGILSAHVERGPDDGARLCLHYDPSVQRIADIQRLVSSAGAESRAKYEHLSAPLAGLRHERQARLVEGVFAERPGVLRAAVALGTGTLQVDFDPTVTSRAALLESMAKAGVATWVEPSIPAEATREREEHEPSGPFGERSELIFSLACGAFTVAGWVAGRTAVPGLVSTGLFVAAYLAGSWFTWKEVVVALRARRFEIDFLMLLAAVGAAVLGDWAEGALLLFLFSLGHALEGFAMGKARNAIAALARLAPSTALRVDPGGSETEIPVSDLRVDDRVLIKPNTRIPVDGFVTKGTSAVNQAPITGESLPAGKGPVDDAQAARERPGAIAAEHRVFAGTINGPGALTVTVTRLAADSTLARVVRMVSEAETQKGPTQRFTESFERIFVPVILGGVALLLLAGFVIDEPFSRTFYRAMAVLVAASPCALAIATPSAVLSGVARAAGGAYS